MNFQMWCYLLAGIGILNVAFMTAIEEDRNTKLTSSSYITQEECNESGNN